MTGPLEIVVWEPFPPGEDPVRFQRRMATVRIKPDGSVNTSGFLHPVFPTAAVKSFLGRLWEDLWKNDVPAWFREWPVLGYGHPGLVHAQA
jgi:hypothetical protein